MNILSFIDNETISHPNIPLSEHLQRVNEIARCFINEKPDNLKILLSDAVNIVTKYHDIAKATEYFQEYIRNINNKKNKNLTHHSPLSSIFAYHEAKKLLNNEKIALLCFATVYCHHKNLINIRSLKNIRDIIKQIFKQYNILPDSIKNLLSISDIEQYIQKSIGKNIDNIIKQEDITNYILFNLIYSILVDSDILHAGLNYQYSRKDIENIEKLVKNYIEFKRQNIDNTDLNNIRQQISDHIDKYVIDTKNKIFKIQLPTGAGKTLSSLHFAFKLRKKLYEETGKLFRIIYCLPFLSITEQNYDEIEKVFIKNNINVSPDLLLKHHHLVDLTKIDDEYDAHQAEMFVESWNSEVIVTTFYQLFHTLFTNKKSELKKFHKLSNSIILIDEIQTVNTAYYHLIDEFLPEFADFVNCYIILLTATQPQIFENSVDVVENYQEIAKKEVFNRYKIIYNHERQTLEQFIENFTLDEDKKYLFIMNTIGSTKQMYGLLKYKYPNKSMSYLSTHIVSDERLKRIKEIKEGKYDIVVSTQLVEAGVDIDFDVVVRDMAGFDSIVQSAGRCNREGKKPQRTVYVYNFVNNDGKRYAVFIYDTVILDITEQILKENSVIDEKDIYTYIEKYFSEIKKRKSDNVSRNLIYSIKTLNYDNIAKNFHLIDKDLPTVSIFVCIDNNAEQVFNKFEQIIENTDFRIRQRELNSIKTDFYRYVINVRYTDKIKEKLSGLPYFENHNLFFVSKNDLKHYYNIETGLITDLTDDNII